jgi:hypothetical protein
MEKLHRAEAAAIEFVNIVLETIRDCGSAGIPSGVLYACVMSIVDIDTYNGMVSAMISSGRVRERHHVLYWNA